jgi:predicted nucleotidyltransferase
MWPPIRAAARERSEAIQTALREKLVGLLVTRLDAKSVWLFGSAARGEATRNSDADLLVISGDAVAHLPWKTRWNMAADAVDEVRVPGSAMQDIACDLVVWSESEFREKQSANSIFVRNILNEGVLLYPVYA